MTYLILHGSFGSPEENWFTWAKLKLEQEGNVVYCPALAVDDFDSLRKDDNPRQNLKTWLEMIQPIINQIEHQGEPATIIAHSISPAFALSLMDANPKLRLEKLIAVSPFLHHGRASEMWQFKKVNDSFLSAAEDIIADELKLKDINSRINQAIVIYGDDDPYVETEQSLEYAQLLNARVVEVKGGGHLNAEAGYTEFLEILNLI